MGKKTDTEERINLFKEFPSTTLEEWKEQIAKDLNGEDYNKNLVWKTSEGFDVEPFYIYEDLKGLSYLTGSLPGEYPFVRGNNRGGYEWEICEEISGENINDFNKSAKEALLNGADSLTFTGLSLSTREEISELLKDLPIGEKKLNFDIDFDNMELINLITAEAEYRNSQQKKLSGAFYFSPLNDLLSDGGLPFNNDDCFQRIKEFITEVDSKTPEYKALAVNSESFSGAGSSVVKELAFSLAMGCEYIVNLEEKGLDTDLISKKMVFQFSVSPNYFMEIAKLRAARLLWAKIVEKFNPGDRSSCEMAIHCKTAESSKAHYDSYEKMLRDTVESMAAIIGGCNSLTVLPFDQRKGTKKEYSDRLPRNTQLVLKEEAYLNKIIDPGSGSYYIEKLTDILANKALALFQSVEKMGGFIKCVENSYIQDQISEAGNSAGNTEQH